MIETDTNNDIAFAKTRYKQTKLGLIPEDWSVCTLRDIANKNVKWSITGGPFGSDLKAEHYKDEGIRIIQLQNIGDGEFRNNSKIYTSLDKADQLLACNIFPGEIILSKMGDPVARACMIPHTEKRWLMGSDGIRLVVDESQYDKRFVLDYLNYSIFRKLAISRSTGSTRRRIGLVDLKKIPFIKLPLLEQQKIASILNTWDKAIAAQEKLIAQKQALKKGLIQQLLTGKKRFAGFEEKWEEIKIKDITKLITKGTTPTSLGYRFLDEGINFIKAENISKSGFVHIAATPKISIDCDKVLKRSRLRENDIVFSIAGTLGRTAIIIKKDLPANTNQALSIIRLKDNQNIEFINFCLNTDSIKKYIEAMVSVGAQPNINLQQVGNIKLNLPSKEEQLKIVETLKNSENDVFLANHTMESMKKQKQGLMQQLLTGEKRVKL